MKITSMVSAAALTLLVAACGTNDRDRVQGGAAAGAATGAGVGALGGPVGVVVGGVIGGGAGAVTGATTDSRDLNLGKPVWRNPEVRTPMDDSKPRRNASTTHRSRNTARATPATDRNRAYMGGGMVPGEQPATTSPAATPAPASATPSN
jgi:hypothetical protein